MRKTLLFTLLSVSVLFSSCETVQGPSEKTKAPVNEAPIVLDGSGKAITEEIPEKEDNDIINIPVAEEASESAAKEEALKEEEPPSFEGYVLSENDVSENGVYLKSVAEEGRVVIDFAGDIKL